MTIVDFWFESRRAQKLGKLNFGVVSASKMLEVVHVESVDDGSVGLFRRHQMHVVIDAAAAYPAGLSDSECLDDFHGRKFDHRDSWQNGFREHPNGEIGSDPDTKFSARQGREGFQQRMGIDSVATIQ